MLSAILFICLLLLEWNAIQLVTAQCSKCVIILIIIECVYTYCVLYADILQDFHSTVLAIENSTVNISCALATPNTDYAILLFNDGMTVPANGNYNNITWSCFSLGNEDVKNGYNISIKALSINNGTSMKCRINRNCETTRATLIVVKGT